MSATPRLSGFDHTLPLLREGYQFLPRRFRRLDSDVFETRLLLRKTICLRGREAAAVFYDPARFRRHGAAPGRVKKTLFGRGGVQGLDGKAHRHRKAMFMSLMGDASIARLVERVEAYWREAVRTWSGGGRVELMVGSREVLTRAVCDWAAVPLPDDQVTHRARQLARLIDAAGGLGPRYWKGRLARKRANAWIEEVIEDVRAGRLDVPEESAAHVVARHREEDGALLEPGVAAVELLNLLRPTVAINRYITFAALALHEHPGAVAEADPPWDWDDPRDAEAYAHEVRRYYPFFPLVAARVREAFEWRGSSFPEGRQVVLDLYGTNHDARLWEDPERFRPERFRGRDIDANTLIPQGGGDHYRNHRCAGEWITIAVTRAVVRLLTREMRYRVPEQDLRVSHGRIPTAPASGFVMADVQPVEPARA